MSTNEGTESGLYEVWTEGATEPYTINEVKAWAEEDAESLRLAGYKGVEVRCP